MTATRQGGDMLGVAAAEEKGIDTARYRRLFKHLPTAVVAITGVDAAGEKLGMVVGTFQSLSLDPPLVMFSVDKTSSTWPKIRRLKHFTASVLGAEQVPVCRQLSKKGPDKLAGVPHHAGPLGTPHIEGALAWLDCSVTAEIAVGDHFMVVGAVTGMGEDGGNPLLFLGREFGRYEPLQPVAPEITTPVQTGVAS